MSLTDSKGPVITFGEIMLRLSPPEFFRFSQTSSYDVIYGGGEANVAASLANYGIPVEFVTRLPLNDIAERGLAELRGVGVGVGHAIRGGDRIGIYFCETGAVARGGKVIYDRAHSAFSEIEIGMIDWEAALAGARWFHWTGITPAVSQSAAEVCMEAVQTASQLGIPISCDLNFRNKLWRYGKSAAEVMEELVSYSDVIMGNEEDAQKVFGIHAEGVDVSKGEINAAAYQSVAEQMQRRFPRAKHIVITLRESISASHNSWSGVLWDGSTLHQAQTYQITHIVDRVGSGDAFMAGMIYGFLQWPDDPAQTVSFATAASCLKHTVYGDFNRVSLDEVEKLMSGDATGRVDR